MATFRERIQAVSRDEEWAQISNEERIILNQFTENFHRILTKKTEEETEFQTEFDFFV